MPHDHDSSYKFLFSTPELVRDLIIGFVPDEWLHSLDYSTLEKIPDSYVSEDFRHRSDDVIWRVKVADEWVYLYLLIEFQSSIDKYMALRMMVYQGLLYQDLIKRKEILKDGRLPPILPIVLYNGNSRWSAAHDVFDLIPTVPGLVEQFKPKLKYLLIDEKAYTDKDHTLGSLKNLVAAVFRIEHSATPASICELLGLLNEWLSDRPDLRRMFAVWIRATLMRKEKYHVVLPQIDDLQEVRIMLSERLEEWAHAYKAEGMQSGMQQGIEKGMQQGMQQGEIYALQRLLSKRFGLISEQYLTRIQSASLEQIEHWLDRVIDAPDLASVFEDAGSVAH